jgi:EAL domain-containing protein (putative c-di-GMP-specific phosphodiesterase class I)
MDEVHQFDGAETAAEPPADLPFINIASDGDKALAQALTSIRTHLGMEVAYILEFVGHTAVLREVDAPGLEGLLKPGDIHSLDDLYCLHILEGRLPEVMADTADFELARSLPITAAIPIGAHMSIPIRDAAGKALGMFGCLSLTPNRSLDDRKLQVMRLSADVAAIHISRRIEVERELEAKRARIRAICSDGAFSLAYQPIWELHSRRLRGFEALCRFDAQPDGPPDALFREAADIGCEVDLEMAVIRRAVSELGGLGDELYLSVNASPRTVVSGALTELLGVAPLDRLVLEITEHAAVEDYDALGEALAPLRATGLRLAVDDAGAGYSSLQHIVRLKPDIVKLDMSLTRDVDADPARQALASAMCAFCRNVRIVLVAEGIETGAELEMLRDLGVPTGQGFHLGRPAGLKAAHQLARRGDAALCPA